MTRFQYLSKNKTVWLIKPSIDTRDDVIDKDGNRVAFVKSRIGLEAEAVLIDQQTDLYSEYINKYCKIISYVPSGYSSAHVCQGVADVAYDVIICDEAQFLTELQVEQLKDIASLTNTDILCFGLRTDFKTKLFPGSKRLFELADKTIELESICECGQPALINARVNKQGKVLTQGAQVDIGGDDKYKTLCWKCYKDSLI
jgi:thymidine kinase